MKDCAVYWDLMSAGLDGALTPEERTRLDAHLARCPECREMLAQLEQMGTDLGGIEQPGPGFAGAVMAEVARTEQEIPFTNLPQNREAGKRAKERVGQWWKPIRTWGAIAACCLLILGLGRMIGMSGLYGTSSGSAPAGEEMTAEGAEAPMEAEPQDAAEPAEAPAAMESAPAADVAEAEGSAPAEDTAAATESAAERTDGGMVLAFSGDEEVSVFYETPEAREDTALSAGDRAALLALFDGLELVPGSPDCAGDIRIEGTDFTLWVHTESRSVIYQGDDGQVCSGTLTEEQLGQLQELLGA